MPAIAFGQNEPRHTLYRSRWIAFDECVEESLGLDRELTQPIHAVIRSEGEILDDHSFALDGSSNLGPHTLFPSGETRAAVLPGI